MEEVVQHKILLSFGQNRKRIQIEGGPEGVTKQEIREAAANLFGLEVRSLIIQAYDTDFDDYVDVEEETLAGPVKVLVRVEEPIVFPVTINVSQGDIEQIEAKRTDAQEPQPAAEQQQSNTEDAEGTESDATCEEAEGSTQGVEDLGHQVPVIQEASTSSAVPSSIRGSVGWITRFSIPTQPPTITSKLKLGGDMNIAERSHFLESIYLSVTNNYGIYYPTKTDYSIIVDKIFEKFPAMSKPAENMPLGDKKCLWKQRLQYKFRNQRRRGDTQIEAVNRKKLKVDRKPRTASPPVMKPPAYWGIKNYLPDRPASEDELSIAAHIKWLAAEKRKKQPDYRIVAGSMSKTLADRRKWLINTVPKPTLTEVKDKFPWLFDEEQMSEEMQRLKDDETPLQTQLCDGLKKYANALIQRCKGRRRPNQFIEEVLSAIPLLQAEKDKAEATLQAAFLSIPGLFKELITDILVPAGKMTEKTSHVFIKMDDTTPYTSKVFTLEVDGTEVAVSTTLLGAATLWIESFYVFNLGYPSCVSNSLTFLQRVILLIDDQLPISRSIRTQVNLLSAVKC